MATRGRPKGAKSFVNVEMETLTKYFGAKQHIPVSRVWLEKLNIKVNDAEPNVIDSASKATHDEKIDIQLSV
tara:strand:- start:86 stop:301 length:216 start_codon:yes stop_codon:yes gene_type:complete